MRAGLKGGGKVVGAAKKTAKAGKSIEAMKIGNAKHAQQSAEWSKQYAKQVEKGIVAINKALRGPLGKSRLRPDRVDYSKNVIEELKPLNNRRYKGAEKRYKREYRRVTGRRAKFWLTRYRR